MTRYLKQRDSNYVTIWAPIAAKRPDQVEINEDEAKKLLVEQQKTNAQKMAEGNHVEPEPPEPEGEEIKLADEEPEGMADDYQKGLKVPDKEEVDSDIKMLEEIRIEGKGKAKVESYMLEKYGIDIDRRFKLDELVDQAVAARKAEFEKSKPDPEVAPVE